MSLPIDPTQASQGSAAQTPAPSEKPTIDAIHRDVALANQYRLELLKILLAITTALFAFTVSFRPSLTKIDCEWWMYTGWIGLGISLISALANIYCWDLFYISFRDYDWRLRDSNGKILGIAYRERVTCVRRLLEWVQFIGFFVGILGVAMFAATNLSNTTPQMP